MQWGMMSIIGCLYVGSPFDQQLDHFTVTSFVIIIYSMVQWRHARLILQVNVPALIKELLYCPYVSIMYVTEQFRFLSAKMNGI